MFSLRRMTIAAALVVAISAMAASAAAQANSRADTRSLAIASVKWHNAGKCPDGRDIEVIHAALDSNSDGHLQSINGQASTSHCRITLNNRLKRPRSEICTTIVHEVGHLMDYRALPGMEYVSTEGGIERHDDQHSAFLYSVMYPLSVQVYPRCERKRSRSGARRRAA